MPKTGICLNSKLNPVAVLCSCVQLTDTRQLTLTFHNHVVRFLRNCDYQMMTRSSACTLYVDPYIRINCICMHICNAVRMRIG